MIELISIHIPKTAGRSFLSILNSVYGDKHVSHYETNFYPDKSTPEILQFKSQLKEEIKVIHGHFHYKEIQDIHKTNSSKVITWLRNPVERVISNYSFFIKRTHASADQEMQRRKNETLLEYARLENSKNRMVKFMDGLNVQDFYFIGLMENFDKDMEVLSEMLHWNKITIPRINDNSEFKTQLPQVTREEKKIIENLNKEDIQLYKRVLEIHKNRKA
jgi:hypothetical protein